MIQPHRSQNQAEGSAAYWFKGTCLELWDPKFKTHSDHCLNLFLKKSLWGVVN